MIGRKLRITCIWPERHYQDRFPASWVSSKYSQERGMLFDIRSLFSFMIKCSSPKQNETFLGFFLFQDPVFPLFEGDDLKKLVAEIDKARKYLTQAKTFR